VLIINTKLKEVAEFILTRNIIHTSLTKCKRVTYAMLTLELYIIIVEIDILIALSSIINMITNKLKIKQLLIIIYTNFLSLYKYIIKLSIIKKKRLIINIISICWLYNIKNL